MEPVFAYGTCRPGLGAEIARRALRLVSPDAGTARVGISFGLTVGDAAVPLLLVVDGDDCAVAAAIDRGADDAVALSASDALIAARLAALVRRTVPLLCVGDLVIDRVERRVTRDGRTLDLLPREYRLLLHLATVAGRTVSRAELLRAVWGLGFDPGTNVVAVHVSRLRARLDRGFAVPLLLTEKGAGYRLAPA